MSEPLLTKWPTALLPKPFRAEIVTDSKTQEMNLSISCIKLSCDAAMGNSPPKMHSVFVVQSTNDIYQITISRTSSVLYTIKISDSTIGKSSAVIMWIRR